MRLAVTVAFLVLLSTQSACAQFRNFPLLQRYLRRNNPPVVRIHAAQELGDVERPSRDLIDDLIEALDDPNEMVRFYAADSLGRIGLPEAKSAEKKLLQSLGDDSWLVRRKAATALGAIRTTRSTFFQRLEDLYTLEQLERQPHLAVLFLQRNTPSLDWPYRRKNLRDRRWHVRLLAMRHFWHCGHLDDIEPLLEMIHYAHPAIREFARALFAEDEVDFTLAWQLHNSQCLSVNKLPRLLESVKPGHRAAASIVPSLLTHDEPRVRRAAGAVMIRLQMKDAKARDQLIRLLQGDDAQQARLAHDLIDELGLNDKVYQALLARLTHEDSPSLRKIIRSFGPISDEIQATLPALVGRFDAPDERVRLAALRAAHQLAAEGPCLVDPLGELARSKDKEVQLQALQLIADLGPGAGQLASQLLTLALSGRETESRAAAMRAFHAVGGGEALRRASKSDDRERFRAIRARRRGRSVD